MVVLSLARISLALGKRTTLPTAGLITSATNHRPLIAARVVQCIGGGAFVPLVVGIIASAFPHARQQAIGFISTVFPIGSLLGPNVGGWLVSSYGWRSVFWFNVPVGIPLTVAAAILLQEDHLESTPIDIAGSALFGGSLFAFMALLTNLGQGLSSSSAIMSAVLFLSSIVLTVAFLRRQARVAYPLIELDILRKRLFAAGNLFNFLFGAYMVGTSSLIPLYAVAGYGSSTMESGFVLTPRSVSLMAASAFSSFFILKWGYRKPILIGTCVQVVTSALLGLEIGSSGLGAGPVSLWPLLALMALAGLGVGIALPASTNACIDLMADKVSSIVAVRAMFRTVGGTVAITAGTLVIHLSGNIASGFRYLFLGMAALSLLMIPVVFFLPNNPRECPAEKHPSSDRNP